MALAILKLSYDAPGDSSVEGGICGTAFFVNTHEGVTAYHVLNEETFRPNRGFKHARLWAISRTGYIRQLVLDCVEFHPDLDATVIALDDVPASDIYRLAMAPVSNGMKIRGLGYVGEVMPTTSAAWHGDELSISGVDLSSMIIDVAGYAGTPLSLDVEAPDVKLKGVPGFEVSFPSRVGMSGGPVLSADSGDALGFLSFGLPAGRQVKTTTFAVSASEIAERLFRPSS